MRATTPLLLGLLLLAASTACLLWEDNLRVSRLLTEARETLDTERARHKAQLEALAANTRKREVIHEEFARRGEALAQALAQDPLAHMPLSDALRMCIQQHQATAYDAAGTPAGGY